MPKNKIHHNFLPAKTENSFFISIEGIEGAGKSVQIDRIVQYFEQKNIETKNLREPGGTVFGEKLREAILASKTKLHPLAEAHLFASARAQILFEEILPFISLKKHAVICDRFLDSSLVYQGIARKLGIEEVLAIHDQEILRTVPHQTFYLRIDLETSLTRQAKRGNIKDYFEKENMDFYQMLIDGYDQVAKLFPERIKIIDATQDEDNVFAQIKNNLDQLCKDIS